jgi:hypothetical protein
MTTAPTAPTIPAARSRRRSWSGGRTALVVIGALLAVLGLASLAGGGIATWAGDQRDGSGYFTAGPERFSTDSYALSTTSLDVDLRGPDTLYAEPDLGEVRVQLESADAGAGLFVGIGPTEQVAAYLDKVGHDELTDLDVDPFAAGYLAHAGGAPAGDPASQPFWSRSDSGTGARTLTWPVSSGDWTIVVMNADGSAGVAANVSAGATFPVLDDIATGAFVAGGVLLLGGLALIVGAYAVRREPKN